MEEFIGKFINGIIPWLLPLFIFASFVVNYTGKWEKSSNSEGSTKSKKSEDAPKKETSQQSSEDSTTDVE